jgi:hypothetical protein
MHLAPRTLDESETSRFNVDIPSPLGGRYKLAKDWTPWSNMYYDIRAPGIRDMVPDPSRPYFGPYPSSTYMRINGGPNNVPVPPNLDQKVPGWLESPWAARLGAFWWEVLHNTPNDENFVFRDWGSYAPQPMGFPALADIKLTSTRPFL